WIAGCVLALGACGGPSPSTGAPDAALPPPALRVFVAGTYEGRLHVFDYETFERVTSLSIAGPTEVHATPDGELVWTVSPGTATISVVDTRTLSLLHQVPAGSRPVHSYAEPGYRRVWVGNDESADVSVVDLRAGTETRVLTGGGHHKMAMVPDE